MTAEQNAAIIELYNRHVDAMRAAEELMDRKDKKVAARGDEAFVQALAAQAAIADVLEALDLELSINDEDYAVEIVPFEWRWKGGVTP